MNIEAIKFFILKGENLTVEFKESKTQLNKDVYETVCAFSNRAGGDIFLGIKDNGEIVGVEDEAIESIKKDFVMTINNPQKFSPPLYLNIETVEIKNKKILHIHVPMSKAVHSLNSKIYDRNNDSDINITGQNANIAKLYLFKQDTHTEDKIFPYVTMEDFDLELIKRIRIVASNRRVDTHPWKGLSDFELLKSSGLYKVDKTTNKEGFTLGAILLFGKDETIVNALPHHKTDLILRKVNLDRYDDREIVTTNLIDSYYKMMEFAKKHLNDPFYLEGDMRISLRDKIFREAVANSLIHREYSSAYVAKMIIENGKVVFENANIPHTYGELNPSNFTPYPKNPNIAKVFREIGFADELGSGVKNLYKYSKAYGGSDPVIVEGEVFRIEVQTKKKETAQETAQENTKDKILELLQQNPKYTKADLMQVLGRADGTIKEHIANLKKESRLRRVGSTKSGYWEVLDVN
jgi:ATP-dependent DNA helicase RecG